MSVRKLILVGLVAVGAWSTAQAKGTTGGTGAGGASGMSGGSAEAPAPSSARSAGKGQAGLKSVEGTVESMKGNTLSLKNHLNQTHQFTLSSQTRFMEHGKKISRDQIKEGETVRAAYRNEGGKRNATEIIKVEKASQKGGESSMGSSKHHAKSPSQGGTGSSQGGGASAQPPQSSQPSSGSQQSQGSTGSSQGGASSNK